MRRSMIIRRDLRKKGLARMINLSKDLSFSIVPDGTAAGLRQQAVAGGPAN